MNFNILFQYLKNKIITALILTITIEISLFTSLYNQGIICFLSEPPICSDPQTEAIEFVLITTVPLFILILFLIMFLSWIFEKLIKYKKLPIDVKTLFEKNLLNIRILPIMVLFGLISLLFGINIVIPAVDPHPYPLIELNPLIWGPLAWAMKGIFSAPLWRNTSILFWAVAIGYWYLLSLLIVTVYDILKNNSHI